LDAYSIAYEAMHDFILNKPVNIGDYIDGEDEQFKQQVVMLFAWLFAQIFEKERTVH